MTFHAPEAFPGLSMTSRMAESLDGEGPFLKFLSGFSILPQPFFLVLTFSREKRFGLGGFYSSIPYEFRMIRSGFPRMLLHRQRFPFFQGPFPSDLPDVHFFSSRTGKCIFFRQKHPLFCGSFSFCVAVRHRRAVLGPLLSRLLVPLRKFTLMSVFFDVFRIPLSGFFPRSFFRRTDLVLSRWSKIPANGLPRSPPLFSILSSPSFLDH